MKSPNIMYVDNLQEYIKFNTTKIKKHDLGGQEVWVPVRPMGYPSIKQRLRACWLVFSGQADALLWRGQ